MLNLFKKNHVPSKQKESPSNYPKEVIEIHYEFKTAADKLLIEAKSIIADASSKDTDKVYRLESLGFKQSAQVTELKPLIQQAQLSKEQVELLEHYSLSYPNNKFITEEQVKSICHKYNLVCGPVSRFKGFVPEKNLKEIERFKLDEKDTIGDIAIFIEATGKIEPIDWNKITDKKQVRFLIDTYLEQSSNYSYVKGSGDGTISDFSTYPPYTKIVKVKEYSGVNFNFQKENQLNFQICAPVKDMDISGLELTEGYKLSKKHIPDPVVLQPVKGGYLIITAWGDEASDELVVNQKFN